MARSAEEQMAWKPRRLRKQDVAARVAHLQKNLPPVVREVFASKDRRAGASAAAPPKKSKFAVLLWEPRTAERSIWRSKTVLQSNKHHSSHEH